MKKDYTLVWLAVGITLVFGVVGGGLFVDGKMAKTYTMTLTICQKDSSYDEEDGISTYSAVDAYGNEYSLVDAGLYDKLATGGAYTVTVRKTFLTGTTIQRADATTLAKSGTCADK